jgi:hypothetical protein
VHFQKRPPLTSREFQILLAIGLAAVVVLLTLVGADIRLSGLVGGGGGFLAPWTAVRAFVWEHFSPYSAPVVASTQELTYGGPAAAGQNPHILTIPFFLLPFYLPLALVPDAITARGIWLLLNQAALLGTAFLSLIGTGWQPSRTFLVAHSLVAVFGMYPVLALIEGTPAIMLGLIYMAMIWAYATDRDEMAGALAVLALFSWETGFVFLLLFTWRVFHDRRWGVLGGFGMTLTVLSVISFLIYPDWLFPFWSAVLAMTRSPFGVATASILVQLSPDRGARIAQATTVLLVILLIYEWAAGRES